MLKPILAIGGVDTVENETLKVRWRGVSNPRSWVNRRNKHRSGRAPFSATRARSRWQRVGARSTRTRRGERPLEAVRAQLRALSQAALLAEFKKSSKRLPCGTARQRGRGIFRSSPIPAKSANSGKFCRLIFSKFHKICIF